MQVWDSAAEKYLHRPVPAAATVTAADLIASHGRHADPTRARVLTVDEIDLDTPAAVEHWHNHLALWAAARDADDWPLEKCVVTLSAPELTGDQLIGVNEFAALAGIAPATLRSYMSRGEGDVPTPQATISGRNMWARPVAEDWAEQRAHSPDAVSAAVSKASSHHRAAINPIGITNLWDRYTRIFYSQLWDRDWRKRWALRWRSPAAVRQVAEALAWHVAGGIRDIVPTRELGITVRHAFLDELAVQQKDDRELNRKLGGPLDDDEGEYEFYGMPTPVAKMLDWLIRHDPDLAGAAIAEIIGEAERRLHISRSVVERTIRTAVHLDSELDTDTANEFLDRVLPPHDDPESPRAQRPRPRRAGRGEIGSDA